MLLVSRSLPMFSDFHPSWLMGSLRTGGGGGGKGGAASPAWKNCCTAAASMTGQATVARSVEQVGEIARRWGAGRSAAQRHRG